MGEGDTKNKESSDRKIENFGITNKNQSFGVRSTLKDFSDSSNFDGKTTNSVCNDNKFIPDRIESSIDNLNFDRTTTNSTFSNSKSNKSTHSSQSLAFSKINPFTLSQQSQVPCSNFRTNNSPDYSLDIDNIDLKALKDFVNNISLRAEDINDLAGNFEAGDNLFMNSAVINENNSAINILGEGIGDVDKIIFKHDYLKEVSSRINVEKYDPSSPLTSAKEWNDLNLDDDLLKGIYMKSFIKPSKIQAVALPLIMNSNENLIGQAQSGSGKTATFALAMLSKVDKFNSDPQAICICPTRELATQNLQVIRDLGKFTLTTFFLAIPQCNKYDENLGAQIIVGTPGKLMELLKKRQIPTKHVKLFVVDEADEMIDHKNKMAPQVQQIRNFLPKSNLQILLFSATFPDQVKQFAMQFVNKANKITVNKEELSLECVKQFYIKCSNSSNKFEVLSNLFGCMTIGQSVIFVKNRKDAFDLTLRMQQEGHAVSLICGTTTTGPERMDVTLRDKVMNDFRSGTTKVLICTDILARGIDVPQITLVINYDLPTVYNLNGMESNTCTKVNLETYLHRVGRTGRFGLSGIVINLLLRDELKLLDQIRSYYSCEIFELSSDPEEIEKMIKNLRA